MNNIEWKISSESVDYADAVELMELRVADMVSGKKGELLWLVEHPPLYTAGTSSKESDLLDAGKFPVHATGRGGEYTYHGPGQRIVYTLMNLKERKSQDLKKYVCNLEGWIINSLARFGIKGERRQGRVGIWVVMPDGSESKIAAIGIRVRKWVTYHGIAINVNPDLSHFLGIVPCGISSHGVTSMHQLGKKIEMKELDAVLKEEFEKIFLKFAS